MHPRIGRVSLAALMIGVGPAQQLGCGAPDSERGDGFTGSMQAADAAAAPRPDAARSMPATGAAGEAPANGGDASDGAAGAVDGGTRPQQPPCDPSAGGRISAPGRYEGYSEALYPDHERSSFYVEVRDGTRLAMDLFRPVDDGGDVVEMPLPVLWMHTPYNRRTFLSGPTAETYPGFALRLVRYGYVVAIVDFRGLYASFGTNVAFNRGEWVDAARMDAYDITEWLAEQTWSSGKVGMWGCSATGGSQLQAATTAPPHLRAIFPMSCEFDAYPFGVPGGMAPASGDTRTPPGGSSGALRDLTAVAVDGASGRSLLDQAIADHSSNVENVGYVPYRDSVAQSVGEPWWIKSSPHSYLESLNASGIGIYLAANWNEGATKQGVFFTFNNVALDAKLLIGPAGHCEWTAVRQETGFDLVVEELRFFDYWLKDIDNCVMDEPAVYFYTYNAPGDGWQAAAAWPLANERRVAYCLGEARLDTSAPAGSAAPDSVTASAAAELVYTTPPLASDVQVTGHPVAELWLASTATDGDFIVTLQDVAPDGSASSYFMDGRLRASHRAVQDAPYDNLGLPYHPFTESARQPLVPGEPALLSFELLPISIIFRAGHRIRVTLTFAGGTTPAQQPAASVTLYRDADHPSSITLPIIE
jgi:predicted acyl esterase